MIPYWTVQIYDKTFYILHTGNKYTLCIFKILIFVYLPSLDLVLFEKMEIYLRMRQKIKKFLSRRVKQNIYYLWWC